MSKKKKLILDHNRVLSGVLKTLTEDGMDNMPKTPISAKDKPKIQAEIIALFKRSTSGKIHDEQIHKIGEKYGVHPALVEEEIYKMFRKKLMNENEEESEEKTLRENIAGVLKSSGESKNEPDEKYNSDELWVGTQVEKEHADNIEAAKEIAKDHLKEIPDYYSRLIKMEKSAGADVPEKWFKILNITESEMLFELLSEIPARLEKVKQEDIDKEILRLSMIAELDAASLYEQMANMTTNSKIKKILLDVAKEEKTHVGEFQMLLAEMDTEYAQEVVHGAKEAINKIKSQ